MPDCRIASRRWDLGLPLISVIPACESGSLTVDKDGPTGDKDGLMGRGVDQGASGASMDTLVLDCK